MKFFKAVSIPHANSSVLWASGKVAALCCKDRVSIHSCQTLLEDVSEACAPLCCDHLARKGA